MQSANFEKNLEKTQKNPSILVYRNKKRESNYFFTTSSHFFGIARMQYFIEIKMQTAVNFPAICDMFGYKLILIG